MKKKDNRNRTSLVEHVLSRDKSFSVVQIGVFTHLYSIAQMDTSCHIAYHTQFDTVDI